MRGYLMVTRTFRQQGAKEPINAQRLNHLLHVLSSLPVKSADMRCYLMVIHTFGQPGANEPVDARGLESSSAPFVVLHREVK